MVAKVWRVCEGVQGGLKRCAGWVEKVCKEVAKICKGWGL